VNTFTTNSAEVPCTYYSANYSLLNTTNNSCYCWYVNGSGGSVSVEANLTMPNGQTVSIPAAGNFAIFRPTVCAALASNTTPSFFAGFHGAIPGIQLGGDGDMRDGGHAMTYNVTYNTISSNTTYTGQGGIVQLLTADFSLRPSKIFSDWRLDGNTVLYSSATINPIVTATHRISQNTVQLTDSPENYEPFVIQEIWVIAKFQDYCMFKPDGCVSNIYVNLGIVTWSCDGDVRPSVIGEPGFPNALIIITNQVTGPSVPDGSDAFPYWQNTCPE
jgi:hypothetical protein